MQHSGLGFGGVILGLHGYVGLFWGCIRVYWGENDMHSRVIWDWSVEFRGLGFRG